MALHYTEAIETSADLLRLALPRMAQHDGPYHPTVFAVWYQHLAGMNRPLTQALTALNTQLAKAQTEAECDPLTNLLNRRGFERKVRDVANSIPDGFVGCSLLMIDIDRFK